MRYAVAVAEAGHVTRAAAALGMQQPPLSQQIRALEQQLGVALFERHARGVTPTEAGAHFVAEARRILAQAGALQQAMQQRARGLAGRLAVGFTSSAAAHGLAPQVLRECRRSHPDLELDIREANAAELTEAIADGSLHCALLRAPVARPTGLVFETLADEPMVLALPVDHALALGPAPPRGVPLRALEGQKLILVRRPGAPGMYAQLLGRLDAQGVVYQVVAEVERMMTNLNLVAAGAGVSVVPASMQGQHPGSVIYRRIAARDRLSAPLTLVHVPAAEGAGETPTTRFCALARRLAAGVGAGAGVGVGA